MKGKTKGASTIRKPGCRQHEMKNCWRHSRGNLFLANCNWEDSMFACNHLLGVQPNTSKPKALHHAVIHSGSSFVRIHLFHMFGTEAVFTSPI
jgi:hypothetical protein